MGKRRICIAAALGLVLTIAPANVAHAQEAGGYVGFSEGSFVDPLRPCDMPRRTVQSEGPVGFGGSCFENVRAGTVKLQVTDSSGLPVGVIWFGPENNNGLFCGEEVVIGSFPGGDLHVFVLGPVWAAFFCISAGTVVGPGTAGKIMVTSL